MEPYIKTIAGVLLAVVLILTLGRQEKDMAQVLTMVVCCLAVTVGLSYLKTVFSFLYRLEALVELPGDTLKLLLRVLGVGLMGEIAAMLCQDAGVGSLGKALQMVSSAVILYLGLPVLESVLTLLEEILGGL